ncbi:hypothetical protein Fmac_010588 [Flemingia macrophylla]|uniref:Uncharacterized protein n=1 Tax=Flemingia macrophylla TaxID=520843 RepID=A0ABD1MK15_9FABA
MGWRANSPTNLFRHSKSSLHPQGPRATPTPPPRKPREPPPHHSPASASHPRLHPRPPRATPTARATPTSRRSPASHRHLHATLASHPQTSSLVCPCRPPPPPSEPPRATARFLRAPPLATPALLRACPAGHPHLHAIHRDPDPLRPSPTTVTLIHPRPKPHHRHPDPSSTTDSHSGANQAEDEEKPTKQNEEVEEGSNLSTRRKRSHNRVEERRQSWDKRKSLAERKAVTGGRERQSK